MVCVFAPVFVSDDGKGFVCDLSVLGFFVAAAADLFYHDRACGELGHGLVWEIEQWWVSGAVG